MDRFESDKGKISDKEVIDSYINYVASLNHKIIVKDLFIRKQSDLIDELNLRLKELESEKALDKEG